MAVRIEEESNSMPESPRRSIPIVDLAYGMSKSTIKYGVWLINLIFLVIVVTCLVLSKLTAIKTFSQLYLLVNVTAPFNSTNHGAPKSLHQVANFYWQILLIMMIPSFMTWAYAIFKGIFSRSVSHPWPKKSAIALGIVMASFEALAETVLYFVVFVSLPPYIVIFLMAGLFPFQGILNLFMIWRKKTSREGHSGNYIALGDHEATMPIRNKYILIVIFFIGVIIQFGGIATVTALLISKAKVIVIACLACGCLLTLSFVWTNKLQTVTYKPSQASIDEYEDMNNLQIMPKNAARWKATFIASTTRLLLYPIISYCIVHFFYRLKSDDDEKNVFTEIDPWCISYITKLTIKEAFEWESYDTAVFAVHIVSSFVATIFQGVACYMTLHVFGLALPVILATPISTVIYFMSNSNVDIRRNTNLHIFPFTDGDSKHLEWKETVTSKYTAVFVIALIIWISQHFVTGFNLFKSKNAILAPFKNMFVRPYYSSLLLEQYLAINRYVTNTPAVIHENNRDECQIFICSTMYRENVKEMKQLLKSLYRVAKYCKRQRNQNHKFESHIFFDGGCKGDDLSQFAIQLMSLIPGVMKVKLSKAIRSQTPYGYRFTWDIQQSMGFVIHLKDNQKIKNKKRWSQVMYMSYILKYRQDVDGLDLSNTYILTTDADIEFKAESAVVLLDMLVRDSTVGGVCARTHPLGSGLLYWYQIFDYTIGHWLQKSAEHILGSVLCCPGCFSMFRCSALEDCLKTYSSEVETAMEFLMKDMGEDRWLCTLLVENGWRLEYCAISKNSTYCPLEFDEFFKQRRRWIPSTVANLSLLVSEGKKMTSKNESIGWLFIIYQAFIIISSLIAPATVILIVASGLQISFSFNAIAVIVIFVLTSVGYGLLCLYSSQQTQLDIAKLLTFAFSIVMAVVVVGLVKEIIKDVIEAVDESEGSGAGLDKVPIGEITIYGSIFTVVFTLTAILHYREFFQIFHCLWYLLGLPAGYLLLLIYSTANLNSRSWGTREKSDNTQSILGAVWSRLSGVVKAWLIRLKVLSTPEETKQPPSSSNDNSNDRETNGKQRKSYPPASMSTGGGLEEDITQDETAHRHYPWLQKWLDGCECQKFYDCFVNEGYTEDFYVADMTEKDLRNIGIHPEGFVRHLMKAIKKLPQSPVKPGIPKSVADWIQDLKMNAEEDEYIKKFYFAGYFGTDDVENLQFITVEELQRDIGVHKKAHIKRFLQGINKVKFRTEDEERLIEAESLLNNVNRQQTANCNSLDDGEIAFWHDQLEHSLRPIPDSLSQTSRLKDDLQSLRNSVLVAILLINLIWIILLYVLSIDELQTLGLSSKVLSLAFLAVYGVILIIQFTAMLFHRIVTMAHYISRLNQSLPVERTLEMTQTVPAYFINSQNFD